MGYPWTRSTDMRLAANRPANSTVGKIKTYSDYGGQYDSGNTKVSLDYGSTYAQHKGNARPHNTIPVWLWTTQTPIFGTPLDNKLNGSHHISASPNMAAFDANKDRSYGYVGPWMRTNNSSYARYTDGKTTKRSYTAEFPYRQNFARLQNPQYVTSPGKNVNQSKLTGQDALLLQMLKRRGYI